jgi:hypothetical protein
MDVLYGGVGYIGRISGNELKILQVTESSGQMMKLVVVMRCEE